MVRISLFPLTIFDILRTRYASFSYLLDLDEPRPAFQGVHVVVDVVPTGVDVAPQGVDVVFAGVDVAPQGVHLLSSLYTWS